MRLLRKVVFYLVTIWAAVTMNFLIPRIMPGDPVSAVLAQFEAGGTPLPPQAIDALKAAFGLDKHQSLLAQYVSYWQDLFHGQLGISFTYFPTPVSTVITQALPWTLILVSISTVLAWLFGTMAGIGLGWKRGSRWDALIPASTFFRGIPHFWIGLLLVTLFGVAWGIFPVSGGYAPGLVPSLSPSFVSSAIGHALLPALTIVGGSFAGHLLTMRNMMVTSIAEDYVVIAEAKGLPRWRVMMNYAARNALIPSVVGFALELGFTVSGALVVEKVFSYPGVGFVMFQAIQNEDYPLIQAIFLVITLAVLLANIVADGVLVLVDPRAREVAGA